MPSRRRSHCSRNQRSELARETCRHGHFELHHPGRVRGLPHLVCPVVQRFVHSYPCRVGSGARSTTLRRRRASSVLPRLRYLHLAGTRAHLVGPRAHRGCIRGPKHVVVCDWARQRLRLEPNSVAESWRDVGNALPVPNLAAGVDCGMVGARVCQLETKGAIFCGLSGKPWLTSPLVSNCVAGCYHNATNSQGYRKCVST